MRRRDRSRNRREDVDAAAAAPAIRQMSAESYATQNNLIGPITRELLVDPVRIQGENTPGAYERANITRWLQTRQTSPNTRQPASENDLVPAEDIRNRIRRFVARYPNSDIVRDWLQQQPAWYTRFGRRIRDTAAPAIATMSRTASNIRNSPTAASCARCCSAAAETGAGAVVGSGVGACLGCACATAFTLDSEENGDMPDEEKVPFILGATGTGAAIGAVYGAAVGPRRCLQRAGEACQEWSEARDDDWDAWGGRKKKTRKNKKKKRRKTRRKKKKKKTRRKRKKNRKKRTRRK